MTEMVERIVTFKECDKTGLLTSMAKVGEELTRCKDCLYMQVEGATRLHLQCTKLNIETIEDGYCHMGVKMGVKRKG